MREGRLVVDRRLQRFLAGVRERVPAVPELPRAGCGRRGATAPTRRGSGPRRGAARAPPGAFARAINAHGHEPVRNPKMESLKARAKEGERAVKRLRQIESKRWWRIGQRIELALAGLRRRVSR